MSHSWENCWTDTKNQFIPLISSNLIGQEHFGPYLRDQIFSKYETCLSMQRLHIVHKGANYDYSNINFHHRPNWEKIKELSKKTKLTYKLKEP